MDYKACAKYLSANDGFLLLTHKNPDGDTVGSAAALCSALRRSGKTAYLYRNTEITAKLLPYSEKYFAPVEFAPDLVIAVDIATEGLFPQAYNGKVQLCIDHHPTNSGYADKLLLKGGRASCGEVVLKLIKAMNGDVTREEAELLYIAVSTDTGCFKYSNTDSNALRTAAELLELGADNSVINTVFFRKISKARMKLEGMIYSGIGFYRDGKVSVATVTRDMMEKSGATEDDCDDLAGLAGKAEGSVVNITIREMEDGTCKVSVRSSKEVSSSDICAVFGGGGHHMAAGCTIYSDVDKAREMLLAVVDEVWK